MSLAVKRAKALTEADHVPSEETKREELKAKAEKKFLMWKKGGEPYVEGIDDANEVLPDPHSKTYFERPHPWGTGALVHAAYITYRHYHDEANHPDSKAVQEVKAGVKDMDKRRKIHRMLKRRAQSAYAANNWAGIKLNGTIPLKGVIDQEYTYDGTPAQRACRLQAAYDKHRALEKKAESFLKSGEALKAFDAQAKEQAKQQKKREQEQAAAHHAHKEKIHKQHQELLAERKKNHHVPGGFPISP